MQLFWICLLPCFFSTVSLSYESTNFPIGDVAQNFECHVKQLQNLTCTWEGTTDNDVKWDLREYSIARGESRPLCDNKIVPLPKPKWACTDQLIYPLDKYTYILEGTSNSSSTIQNFTMDLRRRVQPKQPQQFSAITGKTTLMFSWQGDPELTQKYPEIILLYHLYHNYELKDGWKVKEIINTTQYQLSGLYPNTMYSFKIKCKPLLTDGEIHHVWSPFAVISASTQPDISGSPPEIVAGGFEEIVHNDWKRDILIYWKGVDIKQLNGYKFRYIVTVKPNGRWGKQWEEITTNNFQWVTDLDTDQSYTFIIRAENTQGRTTPSSKIEVPNFNDMMPYPEGLSTFTRDNIHYWIEWQAPDNHNHIDNYTIFYCYDIHRNLTWCQDNLHWIHAPKSPNGINLTFPKEQTTPLRFAIASNSMEGSSGLVWATCNPLNHYEGGFHIQCAAPTADDLVVIELIKGCNFEHIDKFIVECHVADPNTTECKEQLPINGRLIEIQVDSDTSNIVVDNLLPNTKYMFKVRSRARGQDSQVKIVCARTIKAGATPVVTTVLLGVTIVVFILLIVAVVRGNKCCLIIRQLKVKHPASKENTGKASYAVRCLRYPRKVCAPYDKTRNRQEFPLGTEAGKHPAGVMGYIPEVFPSESKEFGSTHCSSQDKEKREISGRIVTTVQIHPQENVASNVSSPDVNSNISSGKGLDIFEGKSSDAKPSTSTLNEAAKCTSSDITSSTGPSKSVEQGTPGYTVIRNQTTIGYIFPDLKPSTVPEKFGRSPYVLTVSTVNPNVECASKMPSNVEHVFPDHQNQSTITKTLKHATLDVDNQSKEPSNTGYTLLKNLEGSSTPSNTGYLSFNDMSSTVPSIPQNRERSTGNVYIQLQGTCTVPAETIQQESVGYVCL